MSRNTLIQDYNRKHTFPTAVSEDSLKQVITDFFLWKPLAITSTRKTSTYHSRSRTCTFPIANVSKSASSISIKFTIPRVSGKEALLRNKKDKHEAPRTAELKFKLWLESDPEWRAEKRKGEKEWHELYALVASHAGVTSVRGRVWLHTQHFSEQSQRSHQYFLWKPLAIAPTRNTFMQHSLSRTRTSPTAVFQEGHWAQLPNKITVPKLPWPRQQPLLRRRY